MSPAFAERPILCLVTDGRRLSPDCDDLVQRRRCVVEQIRYAVEAGIDLVQIRERELETSELVALVSAAVRVAEGTRTRIVVNDRLDVALACGAAGVHLRGDSVPVSAARSMTRAGFLVGRSVHGVDDAREAAGAVDYVIAGTVFPTSSKPGAERVLDVDGLADIVRAIREPVLAIGGMAIDRLPLVAAAGAAGIAAIGLFMGRAAGLSCRAIPIGQRVEAARRGFDSVKMAP